MLCLLVSLLLLISPGSTLRQSLQCYEQNGQRGDEVRALEYIPHLSYYNFNNRIKSCCFTGIWILFENPNYNLGTPGARNWWGWGESHCINAPGSFLNTASSLRFTGAPDDWRHDTINFYVQENFSGAEFYTYQDNPRMVAAGARSVVVTGCQGWTVYPLPDYRGRGRCLLPSDEVKCQPGFYGSALRGDLIGSVRRGCYSNTILYPDNIQSKHKQADSVIPS